MHDTSHFSNNCLQTDYFTVSVGQKFKYTKLTVPLNSLKILENDAMVLEASDRPIDII